MGGGLILGSPPGLSDIQRVAGLVFLNLESQESMDRAKGLLVRRENTAPTHVTQVVSVVGEFAVAGGGR